MIRNIVFDISNVLAPFRFKEFLAEKGFDAVMIKRIIKASAMTPYWTEYEKGKLTYEEAIEAFLSVDPDIRDELHKAYDSCSGIMGRYDYTEGWIDALKDAGYKIYCITNFTPAGYEQCYESFTLGCKMLIGNYVKGSIFLNKDELNRYDCMAKTLFRLLLKLVLLPVSLVLLLAKGAICLAMKMAELPFGLFVWLMGIIIVFCIFNQRWRDVGVGALIVGVVYGFFFLVTLLEAMIDGLQEKIRSI